jgi:hypothetical protein
VLSDGGDGLEGSLSSSSVLLVGKLLLEGVDDPRSIHQSGLDQDET